MRRTSTRRPVARIERDRPAERRGQVQRAVDHERRRFELGRAVRVRGVARAIRPCDCQPRDVLARDLREGGIAAAKCVVAVRGPLAARNLRRRAAGHQAGRRQMSSEYAHES